MPRSADIEPETHGTMAQRLPSLNALRAFEAVARTGSVRAAATELNVVHGAVSQQIKVLEDQVGAPLFTRSGRKLALTDHGKRYADALNSAFSIIERAGQELAPHPTRPFRLGVTESMATYWLIPRLPHFKQKHPEVALDLVTIPLLTSLSESDLDAVILGADYRPRPDIVGTKIIDDIFGPVATFEVVKRFGLKRNPHRLAEVPLLTSAETDRLFPDWFREAGVEPVRFAHRLEFERLLFVIAAVKAGLGIAVVPLPSVAPDLKDKRLVAPFGTVKRRGGYYLCCRRADAQRAPYRALRDWLVTEGAADAG